MDAWIIARYAEIVAIAAEIEGMKAANKDRWYKGESMAYNESAFQEKAILLQRISDLLMQNRPVVDF